VETKIDINRKNVLNVDLLLIWFILASTQTITNSYDDQEPTQPIKVWNQNENSKSFSYEEN
jgi:hypothetical protein